MCKLISITSTRKEIVDQFPIADRDEQEVEAIKKLIDILNNNTFKYEDCKITEYLIICLKNEGFVKGFADYFDCNTYKSEPAFCEWHKRYISSEACVASTPKMAVLW